MASGDCAWLELGNCSPRNILVKDLDLFDFVDNESR